MTPHLGASTEEAQIEVAVEAAEILIDAIKGGPVRNATQRPVDGRRYADPSQLGMPNWRTLHRRAAQYDRPGQHQGD